MNKVLVGVILGAILGLLDGATAWFTPEARSMMLTIIIGSTIKGVMAGVAAGFFARKVQSTVWGIVFGLAVGLALAYWVAAMQGKYYFEIMLPGAIVGAILGWATQRYGRPAGSLRGTAAAIVAFTLLGTTAYAHDGAHKVTASAAFDTLKSLAGTWQGRMLTPDGDKTTVEYRVTDSSAGLRLHRPRRGSKAQRLKGSEGLVALADHFREAGANLCDEIADTGDVSRETCTHDDLELRLQLIQRPARLNEIVASIPAC